MGAIETPPISVASQMSIAVSSVVATDAAAAVADDVPRKHGKHAHSKMQTEMRKLL